MPSILKEDDFIIQTLDNFAIELSSSKPQVQTIDKYACILTAYMQGQMKQIIAFERRLDKAIRKASVIANT